MIHRVNIRKITYKRRRFYIELRPDQETGEQNAVGFHMDTYDGCKLLWRDCIDYHAFFRCVGGVKKGGGGEGRKEGRGRNVYSVY